MSSKNLLKGEQMVERISGSKNFDSHHEAIEEEKKDKVYGIRDSDMKLSHKMSQVFIDEINNECESAINLKKQLSV